VRVCAFVCIRMWAGFFERLMARASWNRDTASQPPTLSRHWMRLTSGGQRFKIQAHEGINCLSLEVWDGSPVAVLLRVTDLVEEVATEVMSGIKHSVWLCDPSGDVRERTWLRLESMRECVKSNTKLIHADNVTETSCAELKDKWAAFLVEESYLDSYDLFLSYRWPDGDKKTAVDSDDRLTEGIFRHMARRNISEGSGRGNEGDSTRPVTVFKDSHRLRNGTNFLDGFAKALCRSRVLVPIVSTNALVRMRLQDGAEPGVALVPAHDEQQIRAASASEVDCTLLEWIMRLTCSSDQSAESLLSE